VGLRGELAPGERPRTTSIPNMAYYNENQPTIVGSDNDDGTLCIYFDDEEFIVFADIEDGREYECTCSDSMDCLHLGVAIRANGW
jgi:hypothetical protein